MLKTEGIGTKQDGLADLKVNSAHDGQLQLLQCILSLRIVIHHKTGLVVRGVEIQDHAKPLKSEIARCHGNLVI